MPVNTGVYTATKKDGSLYYRTSITYRSKHISLGSYSDYNEASQVYSAGRRIVEDNSIDLNDYNTAMRIPHAKFVSLVNFRDNGIYFPNPIYLRKQYFEYYLSFDKVLKFDRDDLFFYASHKIQQRGGYLFVSDYGSQYKILSRYGIKPFAVYGRDYIMINGDKNDYRYSNIRVLNSYIGVQHQDNQERKNIYTALIHINGNSIIGHYASEVEAAVAYNKAVDTLHANGFKKAYLKNYIVSLSKDEYHSLYESIQISERISDRFPDE